MTLCGHTSRQAQDDNWWAVGIEHGHVKRYLTVAQAQGVMCGLRELGWFTCVVGFLDPG